MPDDLPGQGVFPGLAPKPRRKPGPKPRAGGPLKIRVTIKASDEWAAWLATVAAQLGVDQAATVDLALVALAREHGIEPPPRRYPADW